MTHDDIIAHVRTQNERISLNFLTKISYLNINALIFSSNILRDSYYTWEQVFFTFITCFHTSEVMLYKRIENKVHFTLTLIDCPLKQSKRIIRTVFTLFSLILQLRPMHFKMV